MVCRRDKLRFLQGAVCVGGDLNRQVGSRLWGHKAGDKVACRRQVVDGDNGDLRTLVQHACCQLSQGVSECGVVLGIVQRCDAQVQSRHDESFDELTQYQCWALWSLR